ncbi:GRAM domain-containing protein 1A-like [Notechis scutatus]|uniref:GRAM domain-containing protein 1A-like n=1 Tax=Notechis scutatus TaxID=8663 RepID=A0A6J1W0G2_9SAUR|nr:GRAM domain-containing protein 1A-like [Notechis scutatus]
MEEPYHILAGIECHLGLNGSFMLPTCLCFSSLLVLVILNMMLFYRLWSLEHTARTVESWQTYALSSGKLPQTASEWAEILELQKQFHSVEVQKWKQILKASVELLDEMKLSLEKLQQGIMVAEPPLEPE